MGKDQTYDYTKKNKTTLMVENYFREPTVAAFVESLKKIVPPAVVLDLGAGMAMESNYLSSVLPESEIIALDINRTGIQRKNLEPSVEAIQAEAFHIPLKDASVDGIHSKDMLVHIGDHSVFLKELARVLKTGGLLYLMSAPASVLTGYQYSWRPGKIEKLARKHRLKKILPTEIFHMDQDDWYNAPVEYRFRTAFLFQKEESLSEKLLKRWPFLNRLKRS